MVIRNMETLTKKCFTCGIEKTFDDFPKDSRRISGHAAQCRSCDNERCQIYRTNNKAKRKDTVRKYIENNREKIQERKIQWMRENPEMVKAQNRRDARKRLSTVKGKLRHNISTSLTKALKGNKNEQHWGSLVDFTLEQLKKKIETKFKPGMTWDNYGEWHIDHIIPVSAFNFNTPQDMDFKRCYSLSNLQPLWAFDNLRKSNKLESPFQPSLGM